MYIPYTSSVIGRIYNGSVIQYWRSCTPSRSIGECAVSGLNATFCFLWFTNCVLLFDKNLIRGCLWLLVFVLNILILGIWCSTIPHLPGRFCPCTFFENIGFNTVLTYPFMSHLATQLGYSAGEFQALQLIFCVFWHMQLYMSWYIREFFGFTFLNILYFFTYSCTNIFQRPSLYTFDPTAFTVLVYFFDRNNLFQAS